LGLHGCDQKKQEDEEHPVRGLRAFKVSATAESRIRRFPSVLQPADISLLSFEIAGQLKEINLEAGQKVGLGELMAELDPRSLQAQVEQASAGVRQAEAQLANAQADYQRREELLKRGVTTQAIFDQSKATLVTAQAQLEQARRQLDLAIHNLDRSKLLAPFKGTIAGVEVKSFAQVAVGQPIVTLYSDDRFEMSFLVPAGTFQSLKLGQHVQVEVPDLPTHPLEGDIKQLGSKAEQVSAFPVIVGVENSIPGLYAGMSVEVAVEEPLLSGTTGLLLPLSALAPQGGKDLQGAGTVYVYDPETSRVKRHAVTVGGVRDNRLIVTSGLKVGDIVAMAGVSYLFDEQKVKLLPFGE
jgi:RND family efflux transporter MFP subunit